MTDVSVRVRPGSVVAPRWMTAAAVLLTAAIGLCWQALASADQPPRAVAWGSMGLAAYAAALLCLVGGGRGKAFCLGRWWLGSWILLYYGVAFGLASLTWIQPQTGTATQNKHNFIVAILAVAIPLSLAKHRVHKSLPTFTGLAFTALAFLLIVVLYNQAYRDTARSASGTLSASQALDAALGVLAQTIGSENAGQALSSSASFLLARIAEIKGPAIITQRTPAQIGFTNPAQLIEAPIVAVIPRAAWPGKPIFASRYEYEFSQIYYGLPASTYTSSAITPPADLHRHGG